MMSYNAPSLHVWPCGNRYYNIPPDNVRPLTPIKSPQLSPSFVNIKLKENEMRALTRRAGSVRLEDVEAPKCQSSSDVRIRITVAGMCRTDIYVARGTLAVKEPLILGHEFTGVVVEANNASGFSRGDRVTAIPLLDCGNCACCRRAEACAQPLFLGVEVNGAFAEEIVIPATNIRHVPASMDPRHAAYTEPVAAAMAVLNAPLSRDGLGIVLGDNRIAALTTSILKLKGFNRVERVRVEDWESYANLADFAIETEANQTALESLVRVLRPGGLAILKSRPAQHVPLNISLAVKKGLLFQAVNYASFDDAIKLLASGLLDLSELLGQTYPLENFEEAIAASDGCGSVKSFFLIGS
jgi:threonine dehydrogenase-like Zn-dependent dehydrogenase